MEKHQDLQKHYEKDNVIHGCIALERAAASIYSIFMQLFPRETRFWQDLFDEEIEHISYLTDAEHFGIFKEAQSRALPPSEQAIEKTLMFAEGVIQRAKYGYISLETALTLALKLEESMVETFTNKSIANILAADEEAFQEKVLSYERLHIDKIRNMMIEKGFSKVS